MSASSLNRKRQEEPKQVERDYSNDPVMRELDFFIREELPKEEIDRLHKKISGKILEFHDKYGRVLDFDDFELKKAKQGVATRSAVQKIFSFFERWAA